MSYKDMYEQYREGAERIDQRITQLESETKQTRDVHKRASLYKRIRELEMERNDMAKTCRDIQKYIERQGGD